MSTDLLDIFNAHQGILCCVGAGGKKTTMFRLAREHSGRVGITATAHIEYFPKNLEATRYIDNEPELLDAVSNDTDSNVIAFAQPSSRRGRRAGISTELVETFKNRGRFDLLLVKADGARSRLIKAPAEHEPPIPPCADTIIPVVSAKCMGKKLTEKIAHRLAYLEEVTGLRQNDTITPFHVAKLLSSEQGSLKNCSRARVIPLINMVDNRGLEEKAREAARNALDMTDRFDYVVLATMRENLPVIDVVY
ncbi:MAG TPA: selenium cofactor biosynthesis protein YqeC [Gammaproteobacteria bacterium]|nr:selenium cofactor biosynthesis protein YqeC [Gammaproteobacteria bacterium]